MIAIGTTVVRALEHAALATGAVRSGLGTATQRIGPATRLRAVDGILTGVHEPSTSHYQLLRAFASPAPIESKVISHVLCQLPLDAAVPVAVRT